MRGFSYFISVIASALIVLCVIITAIELVAFNLDFYKTEYERLNRVEAIGIKEDQLMDATKVLLDYTKGNRDNLDVKATVMGKKVDVFAQRDRAHMVDVRNLAIGVFTFRNISAVVSVFLIFFTFIMMRRDGWRIISKSYLWALAVLAALIAGIGVWVAIDFTSFWTNFHYVFFTNDLWLLPKESILIQMVPEQFFLDLVSRIITYSVTVIGVLAAVAVGILIYLRSRRMIVR